MNNQDSLILIEFFSLFQDNIEFYILRINVHQINFDIKIKLMEPTDKLVSIYDIYQFQLTLIIS